MAPLTELNNNAIIGPQPASKKRKSDATEDKPSKKSKSSTSTKNKADDKSKYDVSEITLDGEAKGRVPVFDTCADIRTKINAFMKSAPKTMSSKAGFVREINKCTPETMSVTGLTTFQKKSGPCGGANSPVFYASYVFFEKLRLKQGKPKSKKREEMEKHHGSKGMKFNDPSAQGLILHASERVEVDKYGKVNIHRMR